MHFPRWIAVVITSWLAIGTARAQTAGRPEVVIYGATPGGIATALRAAREGMRVTLVHHHAHVGGTLSNGLGVFDTMYAGKRAPIYDELYAQIRERYADPARQMLVRDRGYEPHAAEQTLEARLAAQPTITVLREFYPVAAERRARQVVSVTFRRMTGDGTMLLSAPAFVDASYEVDLAQVIGAEMTVGRESRARYGEPHAGRVFTKLRPVSHPKGFPDGTKVNVFPLMANELLPGSTGEGDNAIQAYNFRVVLTCDPINRMPVAQPARYERDLYLELKDRWGFGTPSRILTRTWNAPLLIGGNFEYPEGDWAKRRDIAARHHDLAIGLLWFLQHDEAVPAAVRNDARGWGLPRDEFRDNGGFPWEMYVREARRLVGRHVFSEHDGVLAPGLRRAPVYPDAIAITEWPLDSHSCHPDTVPGSDHEGKVLLSEETRPGQIAYRCLLPKEVDNLLVTGCVSSSHIGWGTIRLEPVMMHLGESAAYALWLARQENVPPAKVPIARLQRLLVERGVMISFFNEFDMAAPNPEERAAQFFGPRGFFASYDARLDAPLTPAVAKLWARPLADPMAMAHAIATAESAASTASTVTAAEFAKDAGRAWNDAPAGILNRGAACAWLFANVAR